jgi:AcrR family transcriptional regulator
MHGAKPNQDELKIKDKKEMATRRDLVLDAAEELFSLHGYDGVTIRQVAKKAGVDVALPNYYFSSKQGLYEAVFSRRALILNDMRAKALRLVTTNPEHPEKTIEALLRAFVDPIALKHAHADRGWRHYCRLVAQVNSSSVLSPMMTDHFDLLAHELIKGLRQVLVSVPDKDLYWAYHCLSGALTLTMASTGRIDQLSKGICHSDQADESYYHLVQFFTKAFMALGNEYKTEAIS